MSGVDWLALFAAVYGGSRTVFPSGMCPDMAAGLRAYRLTLGKHAQQEDLVSIFDAGRGVEPAIVDEQRAFFRDWLASIRD